MKSFQEILNEKVYRLSHELGTKTPIASKILQAFKKNIEKYQSVDKNTDIKFLDKEWKKFENEATKIIMDNIKKAFGNDFKDGVIAVTSVLGKAKWQNKNDSIYSLSNDFVININVSDDVNAQKYAKKLKGWINSPITSSASLIYGQKLDSKLQNIEINDSLILSIDSK